MGENKMPLLSVSNVTKIYNEYKALDDVNFDISAGITALLGNNGAGKTTLINGIVGLIEVNQGTFLLNELDNAKDSKKI